MSELCKDCRHWLSGVDGVVGDEAYNFGDCSLTDSRKLGRSKALAYALESDADGGRIHTVLITEREFGCNQFEAKS